MPVPNPVAFSVFNIEIMWYGILIAIGMLLGSYIAIKRAPAHGVNPDTLLNILIISIPCGIIGARAYYVLFNWSMYARNLGKILNTREGGLAIHGGLIAACSTIVILCIAWKERPLNVLDVAAPSAALGQAIGRWGNYFNSEAHGGPTNLPWGVNIDGVNCHPTFLYESIWCLIMFILLIHIAKHRRFEGQIVCLYGVLYSIERFFVEALRTDSLMIGPLKQAQVISLVVIVGCGFLYIYLARRARNNNQENNQ